MSSVPCSTRNGYVPALDQRHANNDDLDVDTHPDQNEPWATTMQSDPLQLQEEFTKHIWESSLPLPTPPSTIASPLAEPSYNHELDVTQLESSIVSSTINQVLSGNPFDGSFGSRTSTFAGFDPATSTGFEPAMSTGFEHSTILNPTLSQAAVQPEPLNDSFGSYCAPSRQSSAMDQVLFGNELRGSARFGASTSTGFEPAAFTGFEHSTILYSTLLQAVVQPGLLNDSFGPYCAPSSQSSATVAIGSGVESVPDYPINAFPVDNAFLIYPPPVGADEDFMKFFNCDQEPSFPPASTTATTIPHDDYQPAPAPALAPADGYTPSMDHSSSYPTGAAFLASMSPTDDQIPLSSTIVQSPTTAVVDNPPPTPGASSFAYALDLTDGRAVPSDTAPARIRSPVSAPGPRATAIAGPSTFMSISEPAPASMPTPVPVPTVIPSPIRSSALVDSANPVSPEEPGPVRMVDLSCVFSSSPGVIAGPSRASSVSTATTPALSPTPSLPGAMSTTSGSSKRSFSDTDFDEDPEIVILPSPPKKARQSRDEASMGGQAVVDSQAHGISSRSGKNKENVDDSRLVRAEHSPAMHGRRTQATPLSRANAQRPILTIDELMKPGVMVTPGSFSQFIHENSLPNSARQCPRKDGIAVPMSGVRVDSMAAPTPTAGKARKGGKRTAKGALPDGNDHTSTKQLQNTRKGKGKARDNGMTQGPCATSSSVCVEPPLTTGSREKLKCGRSTAAAAAPMSSIADVLGETSAASASTIGPTNPSCSTRSDPSKGAQKQESRILDPPAFPLPVVAANIDILKLPHTSGSTSATAGTSAAPSFPKRPCAAFPLPVLPGANVDIMKH